MHMFAICSIQAVISSQLYKFMNAENATLQWIGVHSFLTLVQFIHTGFDFDSSSICLLQLRKCDSLYDIYATSRTPWLKTCNIHQVDIECCLMINWSKWLCPSSEMFDSMSSHFWCGRIWLTHRLKCQEPQFRTCTTWWNNYWWSLRWRQVRCFEYCRLLA